MAIAAVHAHCSRRNRRPSLYECVALMPSKQRAYCIGRVAFGHCTICSNSRCVYLCCKILNMGLPLTRQSLVNFRHRIVLSAAKNYSALMYLYTVQCTQWISRANLDNRQATKLSPFTLPLNFRVKTTLGLRGANSKLASLEFGIFFAKCSE